MASDSFSEKGIFLHVGAAIAHINARIIEPASAQDTYIDSKKPYILYNSDYAQNHLVDDTDTDTPTLLDPSDPTSSIQIESANGKALVLLQHEMYAHRGRHLELMNFMVYPCIIQAVKIGKAKDDANEAVHGRAPNLHFAFDDRYKHHATHVQEIMSLQGFPVMIPISPCWPSPIPQILTAAWRKVASNWADFYMAGFSHWNLKSGLPASLSYDSMVQFLRYLAESDSIIDRTYLELIRSMSTPLTIEKETKRTHQSYHHRNSTIWSEEQRAEYTKAAEEKADTDLSTAEMAKLIETLRDLANLDEKGADRDRLSNAYLEQTRKVMADLLDSNDGTYPRPVVPKLFNPASKRVCAREYAQRVICNISNKAARNVYLAMR